MEKGKSSRENFGQILLPRPCMETIVTTFDFQLIKIRNPPRFGSSKLLEFMAGWLTCVTLLLPLVTPIHLIVW